jgi:hypothetical protein
MPAKFVSLWPRAALISLALVVSGCSDSTPVSPATTSTSTSTASASTDGVVSEGTELLGQLFPDVVDVSASSEGGNLWTFAVTLSSPYDSPKRYADSWRVRSADGTVYGERFLTHDHASEQPFTRSQSGIEIPSDVLVVVVQGRDQISGWGGTTLEYTLPR